MLQYLAQANSNQSSEFGTTPLLILVMVILFSYALSSFLMSKVFNKANISKWKAWVPIYNNWTLYQLGGQNGLWTLAPLTGILAMPFFAFEGTTSIIVFIIVLSYLLSFISGIIMYIAMYRIGKCFGKSEWFILWGIFLPLVWFAILGFDDSNWNKDK